MRSLLDRGRSASFWVIGSACFVLVIGAATLSAVQDSDSVTEEEVEEQVEERADSPTTTRPSEDTPFWPLQPWPSTSVVVEREVVWVPGRDRERIVVIQPSPTTTTRPTTTTTSTSSSTSTTTTTRPNGNICLGRFCLD